MAASLSASVCVRTRLSRSTGMAHTSHGIVTVAAAMVLAAVGMLTAPEAWAENECGSPETGQEVVCSPSTYDPAEGNIFYSFDENGRDETSGDFTIRLTEDLSISYDREVPGDDTWGAAFSGTSASGAVWISPGNPGDYTGDVTLYSSADVTSNGRGIFIGHYGQSGMLRMAISGSDMMTTGEGGHAVRGYRFDRSDGALELIVRSVTIDTTGPRAYGVSAVHLGEGVLNLTAQGLAVTTAGVGANGFVAQRSGVGDGNLVTSDVVVTTAGADAYGVYADHWGTGDVNLTTQDSAVTTTGEFAPGIIGFHLNEGDLNITARGTAITTAGADADGVYAEHRGTGDVNFTAEDLVIDTTGTNSYGVYVEHHGTGGLNLATQDVDITTTGADADGVFAIHTGAGLLEIDLRDTAIAATGAGADGIVSDHGGSGLAHIMVEGGFVHAAGAGASGVRMGRLAEDGTVSFAALVGEDGYRRQTVTVNAPVTGGTGEHAAGVFLAGGGRVAIGPRGSVGAASGIAIHAAGGVPQLHVDLDLAGRRVGTVLQGGEIRNDGGATTLRVNDVLLHDEAAGATGHTVLNGAWDLTLRASDTVAGRAFSAQDFTETYAPRAAVYEALPGLLLRLHSRGPAGERLTVPGSPAWVRVAGGGGRYTPVQASVGAAYNFRRLEVEAGLEVELGPRLTGMLSVRHVYGWGDVSSLTGGGTITAQGLGGAVGVAWTGPRGYYVRGRVSVMDYDVDLTADGRGTLIKEASAVGHSLGFETGRRFTLSERLHLTPRVWVTRSKIDLGFTDAVPSRLWAQDSDRLMAGTGVVAETACSWDDGAQAFAVRGSLDLWRTLGDGTAVNVSQGAPLQSVSDKTRVLLSLGGVYRWGRFSVSSDVAAGGPGSRDQEYAGFLNLGVRF